MMVLSFCFWLGFFFCVGVVHTPPPPPPLHHVFLSFLFILSLSIFSCHSVFCPNTFSLFPAAFPRRVPWQSKVFVSVSISSPDLFHVVLRYANWGGSDVLGRVAVIEDGWNYYCGNCKCWVGTQKMLLFLSGLLTLILRLE